MTAERQRYRIDVDGMHCHACERLVSEQLLSVPGIGDVFADAKAGFVTFFADPAELDAGAIATAIAAAGFAPVAGAVPVLVEDDAPPAEPAACDTRTCPVIPADEAPVEPVTDAPPSAGSRTVEASFAVTGMTCASCVAVIEKVVGRMAGVTTATVNLATDKLVVSIRRSWASTTSSPA